MPAVPDRVLTSLPLLDELLRGHAPRLGTDFAAYRNHTYRVVNFCAAQLPDAGEPLEKAIIAAAFHDLGIWTSGTFDYLAPSERLAQAWLSESGRAAWSDEITAMIHEHHKIMPHASGRHELVEVFRKADWIDVTRGLLAFGLPRAFLGRVFDAFPDARFHWRLVQFSAGWLVRHPLRPLPMFHL